MKAFRTTDLSNAQLNAKLSNVFDSVYNGTLAACTIRALCLIWVGYISSSPAMAEEPIPPLDDFRPELTYKNNCSVCHGDRGDGRSRASTSLVPPPRNFTTASNLTREVMIATVTNGKPGTAMTSWKTQLSEKQIERVVDYVRSNFMQEIIEQKLSYGRLVYGHNCVSCHGDRGQGVKPSFFASAPRSFLTPQAAAELTRERILAAVSNGLPGTAMTGYSGKLSMEHIEVVVDYTRDVLMAAAPAPAPAIPPLSTNTRQASAISADSKAINMRQPLPDGLAGDAVWGKQFFMGNCATCHGTLGDGQGPRAYFMTSKPRNFLEESSRTSLNRPAIFSAITLGRQGTEMPAWGKVLSRQEIANVAEFVFQTFIQPGIK